MAMMGASTGIGQVGPAAPTGPPHPRARSQALGRMGRAVRSNRKATVGGVMFAIFVVVALIPGVIARDDPNATIYRRSLGPSLHHLLGTTAYGQDLFAQTAWGTRDSLLTDVLLVIPLFPLLIVIAAYARNGGTLVLIVVLTATEWSYGARQLRSQALSLRNRDFLEAARVRGERKLYMIAVEIIPTMTSLIVAVFMSSALYALLFASSLQFIGLGDPNSLSWGTMLYWAENNEALQTGQYLWAVAPGACIAALGAAFALLSYAFDEIGNPALRPVRRIRVKSAD